MSERRDPAGLERDVDCGILVLDRDLHVVRANLMAEEILGLSGAALVGRSIELARPDGGALQADLQPARRALERDAADEGELLSWVRPDGGTVWLRVGARPLAGEHSAGAVLVTLVDVVREHAVLARLDERARRLEGVLRATDDYVYVWEYLPDGTSYPVLESIRSGDMFGVGAVDASDAADVWIDHIHPNDAHKYAAVIEVQARGEGGTADYRLVRHDGTVVYVFDRWRGSVSPDGVVAVEGIISDVTALRQAQAASQASAERFRALAETAPIGIYIADATGRIVYGNEQFGVLYGVDGAENGSFDWADHIHPDERESAIAAWLDAVARAVPYEGVLRIVGPDGEDRWLMSRARPMFDADGELLGYAGTDDDITARVRAATELERLSRTDAVTGLRNRRHLAERLDQLLAGGDRLGTRPGVVLLDLDHFKQVNDVHGHQAGDLVLIEAARRIQGALQVGEEAARWGGEEFAVLVNDVIDADALEATGERFRSQIGSGPISAGGVTVTITASGGVAAAAPGDTSVTLVERADQALYAAKRRGRDRTVRSDRITRADREAEDAPGLRMARGLALAASVRTGMPQLHCEQVAELAAATAEQLELPVGTVLACRLAGYLHDVGKLAVPDAILLKKGSLDEDEWSIMRTHPDVGAQIIRRVGGLETAERGVRHHHERFDGTGYPHGLAGEAIPIEARVVAAADVYSAITSDRAYTAERELEEALTEVRRSAGSHLDPRVAEALCRVVEARVALAVRRLNGEAA